MRFWARASLRTKIDLTFSFFIVLLLAITLGFTRVTVRRQVNRVLEQGLRFTGEVFENFAREERRALRKACEQLARDHALKQVVATYDPETLQSVAENARERLEVDLVWITDEAGGLLADSRRQLQQGASLAGSLPLATALGTEETADAMSDFAGGLYQLVAVPVKAPDVIGFLIVGREIDDGVAADLEKRTGSKVSFLGDERVFASTWPPPVRTEIFSFGNFSARSLRQQTGRMFLHAVRGEHFQSLLVRVGSDPKRPVYALVQQSYDREMAPWNELQGRILIAGLVALLGVTLGGAFVAANITNPVQRLVAVMRQVLGGDLNQTVRFDREDEIGFLARTFNEMLQGLRDRERIRAAFGRFVSQDVAEEYLAGRIPLEGDRREVTVLFQDIRGFTSLSERLEPEQVRRILNRFMTEMVAAIEGEGGVVKQFTGDGLMAIFGAPRKSTDHAVRAVRAAVDMLRRLTPLNERFENEGIERLAIGIGIHTGEVVAGPFGPDERVEYAVVGDTTNLASRIEGLTKEMQTAILVSEATAAHLGPEFKLGRREIHRVKGKEKPVGVVEVLA